MILAVSLALLLAVQSEAGCDLPEDNVADLMPWKFQYDVGDEVTISCYDTYVVSSATTEEDNSATIRCGASGDWQTLGLDFKTVTGCVECVAGAVECTGGTCEDGVCVCSEGNEKSLENPRLCSTVQCHALILANQEADSEGPYDVGAVVTVTCSGDKNLRVHGTDADTEQVLTCRDDGNFDTVLKPCIVCASSDDCTNGTCNANNECECDEASGFKLSAGDRSLCE